MPRPGLPSISTRPPTSPMRPRTDRARPMPSRAPSNPCPSSFTEQNTQLAVGLGVDRDRAGLAVLARVGERLGHRARQRVDDRGGEPGQVVGEHHPGLTIEVVLEARGGASELQTELARGGLGPEEVVAQLALLVAGEPDQVGVRGPPLHDGQGLEHAVVQGAGHLLARQHRGDAPLGLPQLDGGVAGRQPGQRVEHERRAGAHAQVGQRFRRARLHEVPAQPTEADDRARHRTAAPGQRHARGEHAGERPDRAEGLRVLAGERPAVAGAEREADDAARRPARGRPAAGRGRSGRARWPRR